MTVERSVKLADLDDVVLTASQGFRALAKFLQVYSKQTNGMGQVGPLVGDVEIEGDGRSTDPAALGDWRECVTQVLAEDTDK
jgi:hypothetical protein